MEEIGKQGMTPYCCRHTFVTRSILSGMELTVLEAIVGHLDRETTKIYTHIRAADLVAAVHKTNTVSNKSVTRSDDSKHNKQKSS